MENKACKNKKCLKPLRRVINISIAKLVEISHTRSEKRV